MAWRALRPFSFTPPRPVAVHVCDDFACLANGAEQVCADLEQTLGPAGAPSKNGQVTWHRSPCLGMCERAPLRFPDRWRSGKRQEIARHASSIVAALNGPSGPLSAPRRFPRPGTLSFACSGALAWPIPPVLILTVRMAVMLRYVELSRSDPTKSFARSMTPNSSVVVGPRSLWGESGMRCSRRGASPLSRLQR